MITMTFHNKTRRTMVKFKLQREVSTPYYTVGMLTEESTGFRCKTLEKPLASHFKIPRPAFTAVVAGEYKMKLVNLNLDFTFGICLKGTYKDAILEGVEKPGKAHAGSVCIGKKFVEGKGLEGGEEVMGMLNKLIDFLIDQGKVDPSGRTSSAFLEITEEDMVTMQGIDLEKVDQKWEPNWNCIEESEMEDFEDDE